MDLKDLNGDSFKVIILDEVLEVGSKDSVKKTLKAELEKRGITSFIIIIDGKEATDTNSLPKTFGDCMSCEVKRYVKGGQFASCLHTASLV